MLFFDSLVFIKPIWFGQINLSKVDSNILFDTIARILQARLIINMSLLLLCSPPPHLYHALK